MTKQRSFASLTEEEINQVAEWLQHGTYDEVRDRIAKPRPEGFGLNLKSKRPLETLWQNKNTVDKINRKLAQGEKLTVSEFNALNSGERADLPEKIQDVIMETTWELATSGENNPTQLLALQRLADFPARAEYREHKRQLELRKEQRDIQKQTHKLEMDQHRKHIDDERLILAQRAQALREQQLPPVEKSAIRAPTASSPHSAIKEDHLDRLARTLDDVERRTCETFNLPYDGPISGPPSSELAPTGPAPTATLPVPINTGLQSGEPAVPCNQTVSTVSSPSPSSPNSDPGRPYLQSEKNPEIPSTPNSAVEAPSPVVGQSAIPAPTASSPHSEIDSSALTETDKSEKPNLQSAICDLKSKVDAYTVKRAQEYWAYRRQYSDPPPSRKSHPQYITRYRHCPCGAACPCPIHENEKTFGPFPNSFWTSSPHSDFYYEPLMARGLPYRDPKEFL